MSQSEKLIIKILSGCSDKNIDFYEMCQLLKKLNFESRIKGSHNIFYKDGVEEIINIQVGHDGKAKPYQVKQIRNVIVKYKLRGVMKCINTK